MAASSSRDLLVSNVVPVLHMLFSPAAGHYGSHVPVTTLSQKATHQSPFCYDSFQVLVVVQSFFAETTGSHAIKIKWWLLLSIVRFVGKLLSSCQSTKGT